MLKGIGSQIKDADKLALNNIIDYHNDGVDMSRKLVLMDLFPNEAMGFLNKHIITVIDEIQFGNLDDQLDETG